MKKLYYTITAKLAVAPMLFLPGMARADVPKGLADAAETVETSAGDTRTDLFAIIQTLIGVFTGLLGIVFVVLIIYAGWLRIASQGAPDKVEKSNKLLIQSTIGLVIIVAAFAISNFVIRALAKSAGIPGY